DERGTEEYNLVLGNRRARAVKNFLVDLGVPSSNLQVMSLGKNEQFCLQATRQCFQKNRRAHFVLQEDHDNYERTQISLIYEGMALGMKNFRPPFRGIERHEIGEYLVRTYTGLTSFISKTGR